MSERKARNPPLVRRFYMRMTLRSVPFIGLIVLVGILLLTRSIPSQGMAPVAAILGIGSGLSMVLWIVVVHRWEKRLIQQLKMADFKLCPHCGYSLARFAGIGRCPECGEVNDISKVEAAWRSYRPRIYGNAQIGKGFPGS